jgi:hypothetical protein
VDQNPVHPTSLARRFIAEGLGTAFLLAAIVGSGIMAERLVSSRPRLSKLVIALKTLPQWIGAPNKPTAFLRPLRRPL